MRQVSLQAIGDLADPSPVALSSCLPANLRLDLVLGLVGQLEAGRPEELDAVVLGWVVRGGDDRTGARPEVGRDEGDRRGRHDARKDGVGSGREDPFHQSALQRLARRPGVSAHDDPERSRRSTMQDHGGRPAQAERELGREVAPVDAANPVRSEEPTHARGKATGNGVRG